MGLKEEVSEKTHVENLNNQRPPKKSEAQKRRERKERKRLAEEKRAEDEEPKIELSIEDNKVVEMVDEEEQNDSQDEEEKKKQLRWWPAMTNSPSILNKLLWKLCGIEEFEFSDVFTFDEDYLKELSSKQTLGVFFCLPIFEKNDFKKNPDDDFLNNLKSYNEAYFFKQTIMNSCSTLCICYLIANHLKDIKKYNTPLTQFILESRNLQTSEEKIQLFEETKEIAEAHFGTLKKKLPQPKTKKPDEKKDEDQKPKKPKKPRKKPRQLMAHFVCFTEMDGYLLELDSRRDAPVIRGKSTTDTVLLDAISIIQNNSTFKKR
eukprot:gene5320-9130_t